MALYRATWLILKIDDIGSLPRVLIRRYLEKSKERMAKDNIPPVIRIRFSLPSFHPAYSASQTLSARSFDLTEIPPTFRASQSERVNFRDETCGSRTR